MLINAKKKKSFSPHMQSMPKKIKLSHHILQAKKNQLSVTHKIITSHKISATMKILHFVSENTIFWLSSKVMKKKTYTN